MVWPSLDLIQAECAYAQMDTVRIKKNPQEVFDVRYEVRSQFKFLDDIFDSIILDSYRMHGID